MRSGCVAEVPFFYMESLFWLLIGRRAVQPESDERAGLQKTCALATGGRFRKRDKPRGKCAFDVLLVYGPRWDEGRKTSLLRLGCLYRIVGVGFSMTAYSRGKRGKNARILLGFKNERPVIARLPAF